MREPEYVLGHTARELDRLDLQGELYRDVTRRALVAAGIAPGWRVIDVGCGSGDVSLLCAELVGPRGRVLGVDGDAGTIQAAAARAAARGVGQVAFRIHRIDPSAARPAVDALMGGEAVDALVGRFFLMHQADPAATLRRAAAAVRPGGSVAFVESSMTLLRDGPHSFPHSPLYDRVVRWKCDAVAEAGADLEAGMRLRRTFLEAGLPAPEIRLEARLEGGPDSPWYRYVEESVRSMLPLARRRGVEGLGDAEIETLARDLRAEALALDAVLVAWPVVAAWCRLPGPGGEPGGG